MDTPRLTVGDQRVFFTSSERMDFIDSESVDFLMTSPPYWNLKKYGHSNEIGQQSYDGYLERMNQVWREAYRVAKSDSVMVINVGNRRHNKRFYPIAVDVISRMEGWVLWDMLIWYVPNALPQPNAYRERLMDNKYEFLLIFTKDGSSEYEFHKPRVPQKYAGVDSRQHNKNPKGRCIGNVIRVPAYRPPNIKDMGYHVAAYPEELVALMLESYTSPGDTVLDPFVGSGTTLKVARGMGRNGIGVELHEGFGPLIERRIMERFELPDWKTVDILHSATMTPGTVGMRKAHLVRPEAQETLYQ